MDTQETQIQHLFEENREILDYLSKSRLFGHLKEDTLRKLLPLAELVQHKPGIEILTEGQPNDYVFFLLRGEVGIYAGGELILQLRRVGDIFGEMSIISSKVCSASVISMTHVNVLALRSRNIGQYSDLNPEELQNVLYRLFAKILSEKLFQTTHKAKQYEVTNRLLRKTQEELQNAHRQLKESNDALESRVEERTQELQSTQAQLIQSAKLASLGQMAAGVAHELNQPLTIISMSAELILKYLNQSLPAAVEAKLKQIRQQVKRASSIITQLRVFGRDPSTLTLQEEDLNTLITNGLILMSEQLRLRNIEVIQDLCPELPLVKCNAIQIEQVLTNLLLNARDALEHSKEKKLTIRTYLQKNWVVLEVKDSGCGISQEDLAKVLDPFFTTKEVGQGTGLGLSVSHGIVQSHHGKLVVESVKQQGTVCRIQLPYCREDY